VLNREIPYHKIKKVIRFRLSEIETWVDRGGGKSLDCPDDNREGDLFAGLCCPPQADSLGVCSANSSKAGVGGNDEKTGGTAPENGAGENEEPGKTGTDEQAGEAQA
jgi:hypothetical protein